MPKRIRGLVCGALVAAALATAVAAQGVPPIKEDQPPTHVSFPAGAVCTFPVSVDSVVNRTVTTTHIDADGNILWIHGSGTNVIRVTNDATGNAGTVNASGPGKFTFDPDGTIRINGTGAWVVVFFPTDSPANAMLVLTGNLVFTVDPNTGKLTLVSHTGTTRDLCAELG
jgi:hypothetical protein